jgi:hypothetical protein
MNSQYDTRSFDEILNTPMTELEELECLYAEMYKDVYGMKARWYRAESVEQARADIARLEQELILSEKARVEQEARDAVKFEKRVEDTIKAGAGNRETALRWIMEADQANGDWEFLCYLNGLPYGFFKQAA